jgi:hypothetical protein
MPTLNLFLSIFFNFFESHKLQKIERYKKNYEFFSFFNQLDTIIDPSFVPSEQDILMTRARTTGVQEYSFEMEDLNIR